MPPLAWAGWFSSEVENLTIKFHRVLLKKEMGTMLAINKESREYDFILDVAHYGGKEAALLLRKELSISASPSKDFPRIISDSLAVSFDSDWDDQYKPFFGDFSTHFPDGYITQPGTNCIVDVEEGFETQEELFFTRFTMHLTCESEYMWDEEIDFETQDYYGEVIDAIWNKLEFNLGSTHVAFAFRTMLDYQ